MNDKRFLQNALHVLNLHPLVGINEEACEYFQQLREDIERMLNHWDEKYNDNTPQYLNTYEGEYLSNWITHNCCEPIFQSKIMDDLYMYCMERDASTEGNTLCPRRTQNP